MTGAVQARGRFITFEGGEGGGKSTQIRMLADALIASGRQVEQTREPGGSERAELIRSFVLSGQAKAMGAATETFLFNAARYDHIATRIAPSLAVGVWVLCDRFSDSTRVYQTIVGGADPRLVRGLETLVVGATRPDLTIILDLPADVGLGRARARRGGESAPDRFEAEDLATHERIRAGFLAIAREEPDRCAVIAADRDQNIVAADIRRLVRERLGGAI